MRRVLIHVVMAALVGVSAAGAAPLNGLRLWASQRGGTNKVALILTNCGITNAADRAAIMASWDEDTLVGVIVTNRAFKFVELAFGRDNLSTSNVERLKAALLAENALSESIPQIAMKFPVAERGAFEAAVKSVYAKRYAAQPEMGRLQLKYAFLQGFSIYSANVSLEDLTGLLLAPERLASSDGAAIKQAIKGRLADLGRVSLRSEGKSFVLTKEGVNPLVAKVQPVIDALNAPACEGLEPALRALGAEVRDYDRSGLRKVTDAWRAQVMRGDVSGNAADLFLGKIAIALGADGFNRFVDEYNNGKRGGK